MDEKKIGIALYTLNKFAKVLRDMKSDFVGNKNMRSFCEWLSEGKYTFGMVNFESGSEMCEDRSGWTAQSIQDEIDEIENAEELDYEPEYSVEELEEMYDKVQGMNDIYRNYEDFAKETKNYIYDVKDYILKKYFEPETYHDFREGTRPLYNIGGFTFHGEVDDEVDWEEVSEEQTQSGLTIRTRLRNLQAMTTTIAQ